MPRRWGRLVSWIASVSLVATMACVGAGVAQAAPGDPELKASTPKITGTLAVGSTLKAQPGKWTAKTKFTYRWLRDAVAIGKATKASYKLTSADAGKQLSVEVTGKRSGYTTVSRTSVATPKVVSAPTPTISGTAVVGSTLTATTKAWSDGMKLTYQWLRSGKKIKGATKDAYVLTTSDNGKQLTVQVTGEQDGWATIARTSAKTKKVMKPGTPKISGTAMVGKTVKVKVGSWTSKTKFSYQWLRDGKSISGAKKSSYKITAASGDKQLSVKVTGKRSGFATATRISSPVTVKLLALKAATPKITGTAKAGSTLTANPGTWTAGAALKYQWYADGKAISKATSKTYKVTYLEGGKRLTVEVTGSKSGYATTKRMSAATSTVPKVPTTMSAEKVYLVGVDVQPGTYVSAGSAECFWWRLSSLTGDFWDAEPGEQGVLGAGPIHNGQTIVHLDSKDPYFLPVGCGQWNPLPTSPSPVDAVGDGDYAVGINLLAGRWKTTNATDNCYVEFASGFAGSYSEITRWGFTDEGETEVELVILATDVRFTTVDCGTWQRIGDIESAGKAASASRKGSPAVIRAAGLDTSGIASRLRSEK